MLMGIGLLCSFALCAICMRIIYVKLDMAEEWDQAGYWLFGGMFCTIPAGIFQMVFTLIFFEHVYTKYRIIDVGGCDRYGICGVILENGTKTTSSYPVVGGWHVVRTLEAK